MDYMVGAGAAPLPANVRPGSESEGYAHPDDRIDRLGRVFTVMKIGTKYNITFERYLEAVESGSWADHMGGQGHV